MPRIVIIGGGFVGLVSALRLAKAGHKVRILEADSEVGGLAGTFETNGQRLEKFYHHWFKSDTYVNELVSSLGLDGHVVDRSSRTGSYYANTIFRLSSPLDLLRYKPLSLFGRIRLGLLVLQVRLVRDWKSLESITAVNWLRKQVGNEVYEKVWGPLLKGKFGEMASEVSAVWFWNKLALRGGSRAKDGSETLSYFKGGFAALTQAMVNEIEQAGGEIILSEKVDDVIVEENKVVAVTSGERTHPADLVINTTALPIFSDIISIHVPDEYLQKLARVKYLGNVCLVLQLKRSLSDTYWLNVTDPDFPFVGVIEHTNFETTELYGGRHIVYLSKYLPTDDALFLMTDQEFYEFAFPYLQKIFPDIGKDDVIEYACYRANYSQPIISLHYSDILPAHETPLDNLFLFTMAQIYPEDRGTNYAIRQGIEASDYLQERILGRAVSATPD